MKEPKISLSGSKVTLTFDTAKEAELAFNSFVTFGYRGAESRQEPPQTSPMQYILEHREG